MHSLFSSGNEFVRLMLTKLKNFETIIQQLFHQENESFRLLSHSFIIVQFDDGNYGSITRFEDSYLENDRSIDRTCSFPCNFSTLLSDCTRNYATLQQCKNTRG